MSLEICGMIGTRSASETDGPGSNLIGGHVDPGFVREFALAHESAGFDRVLVGYGSTGPESFQVAAYAASQTERLNFLIAHRPGFVAPTLAARTAATLDHFCGGRIAMHFITGGSDLEQQRDGDWVEKDERYARTDEYLQVLKQTWLSERPFDFEGSFYQFRKAYSEVRPLQKPHPPVYFGGASGPALEVGAKHCDVYMMWGEPLAAVKERMAEVVGAAERHARTVRFSVSFRPILGATEGEAWDRAHDILERVKEARQGAPAPVPQAEGSQRLLEFAAEGDVLDDRLWTAIAREVGAYGNTTALVGTAEQVAETLLAYYQAGVTTLLLRGFDPLADAVEYGQELIPLLRAGQAGSMVEVSPQDSSRSR